MHRTLLRLFAVCGIVTFLHQPMARAADAAPEVALREYQFPDGTGSVGLADGWTTTAQTCMGGVEIKGPADQTVYLGLSLSVVTPDSTAVRMHEQMVAQAREWRMPAPPALQLLVAPISAPGEALTKLVPQLSAISQSKGGPAVRLDKIVKEEPATATLPGGRAAVVTYDVTRTTKGVARQFRALARIDILPLSNEAFMLSAQEGAAPVETFDRDLPTMLAIAKSWRTNDAMVQLKTAQAIDAQNQWFALQQAAHRDQVEAFDRQNRAWEHRQLVQSRANADFSETIRGYRTVEDTRTGHRFSVDLGRVHDFVERRNARDPGRFREIPLRDELYPLPGR